MQSKLGTVATIGLGWVVAILFVSQAHAATKSVDLDGQAANGTESQCDLNVVQTFPVKIENKVTNKAVGDTFTFSWPSAGPGGFTSSVTAGSTGGVGAKWTWTTNQTVYSYTGSTCATDVCFFQTGGPDAASSVCSTSCLVDGSNLTIAKGATAGQMVLTWTGGQGPFTVYRARSYTGLLDPVNIIGTTDLFTFTDTPPADGLNTYIVRGQDCITRKACTSDASCSAGEGTCVSRGPFGAPGRSLLATDVTVSAASLTSSLITFFSPPKEVFSATSTANGGGFSETVSNSGTSSLTVTTPEYPPGCCPADPAHPHQIRCGDTCVDYTSDPQNCGGCGIVCAEGSCCSDGACLSICPEGETFCDGLCRDLTIDDQNCGTCGNACDADKHCVGGSCVNRCPDGWIFCAPFCYDPQVDATNCGSCGNTCGADSCCNNGSCVVRCTDGLTWCGECTDLQTNNDNCGACGNSCGAGTYCVDGSCQPSIGLAASGPYPPAPAYGSCPDLTNYSPIFVGINSTRSLLEECPINPNPVTLDEAPVCVVAASTTTIPPGGSSTICHQGGLLFKEVPTAIVVCGDGIPGVDGQCNGGSTKITTGTFNRLVPDTSKTVGNAYLTPYAIHVVADTSNDGLLEPGEAASLVIDLLNAGPIDVAGASAVLTAPVTDLSQDGVVNPVGITINSGNSGYGTIAGTPASTDCAPPPLQPASNASLFKITVPVSHPGDTSHPMNLAVSGTVLGSPFSMDVPITLGIADKCDPNANTRDFDGVNGLDSPMAKLVPVGDTVPFPNHSFTAGNTRPMKLQVSCGGANLTDATVDPPEIVGLSEATRGELDIHLLNLNADSGSNPNDPFFKFNNALTGGNWNYNMRTSLLGTGTFTIKIRIAGRKEYVTGFVLQ